MTVPNPLIYIGEGRAASPCASLNANIDVRVKSVDPTNPILTEKKKYFVQGKIRNNGTFNAYSCFAQLWWSPANVTGSAAQLCTGSIFGPPAIAQTLPFTVPATGEKVLPDLIWDVPDLGLSPGVQASYKLILKVWYPGVDGAVPLSPNPSLAPECDPRCGVRAITIVGV